MKSCTIFNSENNFNVISELIKNLYPNEKITSNNSQIVVTGSEKNSI